MFVFSKKGVERKMGKGCIAGNANYGRINGNNERPLKGIYLKGIRISY